MVFNIKYTSCFLFFSLIISSVVGQDLLVNRLSFNTNVHDLNPILLNCDLFFSSNIRHKLKKSLDSTKNYKSSTFKIYAEDHNLEGQILKVYESTGKLNISSVAFEPNSNNALFTVSHKTFAFNQLSGHSLFFSENQNGHWTELTPFPLDLQFSGAANPCFSADGNTIYFESDLPGGYGGIDLWLSKKENNQWTTPVNAGPKINSEDNEKTPFLDKNGNLYFSSNRLNGKGGYDVYKFSFDHNLLNRLSNEINTSADELGFIISEDNLFGYFSSNKASPRHDIYKFSRPRPVAETCIASINARKCFTFYDPEPFADSLGLDYLWDFGDGTSSANSETHHCYKNNGDYTVTLAIYDKNYPMMKDIVGSKKIKVENSSDLVISLDDSTNKINLDVTNRATEILNTPIWLIKDEYIFDQESYLIPSSLKGQYAVKAFFETKEGTHCIFDTLLFKNSPFPEAHIDLPKDKLLLNERTIKNIQTLLSNPVGTKTVKLFLPEGLSLSDSQVMEFHNSFATLFNIPLVFETSNSISSPSISIYYEK